jgi:hypothetical protein
MILIVMESIRLHNIQCPYSVMNLNSQNQQPDLSYPPGPLLSPKAGEKGEKDHNLRVFDRLACQKHARIIFFLPSFQGSGAVRIQKRPPLPKTAELPPTPPSGRGEIF